MKPSDLSEFFNLLGKAKKEKEEEFDNLLKEADINLDDLTSSLVSGIKEAKKDQKKQKKNEEKLIEQLDSIIDVIENPKEVKDITEPAVTVGVPEDFDVTTLEDADDNETVEIIDIIKPEPIKTPEISDTVAQAIKFIEETNIKEEIENSDDTNLDKLKIEIKQVRDILYKVLAHGPGSGEVRVLKMDDVDEDSAKVDGKVLQYQSSSGKFVGVSMASTDNVRTGILDVAGIATFRGGVQFDGNVSIAGTLTYEDVTNVDSVGLITARNGIVVGSGITLSPDGDIFAVGVSTFKDDINLPDNVELKLGSAGEVRLFHSGVDTKFIMSQHYFNMQANGYNFLSQNGSETLFTAFQNGAVSLFFDNTKRFETTNTGAVVTGILTATSDISIPNDTGKIKLGASQDLEINHNGTHSFIKDAGTGSLFVLSDSFKVNSADASENMIVALENSFVKLFFNGSNKLETTNTGITVTGTTVADGADINGDLDASGTATLGSGGSGEAILQYQGSTKLSTKTWGVQSSGAIQAVGDLEAANTSSQTDGKKINIKNLKSGGGVKNVLTLDHESNNSSITGHVGNISINAPLVSISTSFSVGTDTAFTIGAVSSHQLTVANDNASMALGLSNSDALYLRREYATGRYTFQTFNGSNDGSIALQPFGGKVGIASAIPTSTLDVNGDVRVGSGVTLSPDGDIFVVGVSTFVGNLEIRPSNGQATPRIYYDDSITEALIFQDNVQARFGGSSDLRIYHDGSHSYVSDQGTGQLKILSSTLSVKDAGDNTMALEAVPTTHVKLFYNGSNKLETTSAGVDITGDLTVSGSVSEGSDIRLKTNIKPIEDPIDKVTQIEGVSFNWKKDNKPALGVIADQVEKIIPELVQGDDPKTVNYNGLIGLLIEAVKDQQTQIDSLKERLSKLE